MDVVEVDPGFGRRPPGREAVADLVAADSLTHGVAPPLARRLLDGEGGLDVEPPQRFDRR